MTIICQGFSFRVHRAIVCSQSSFFESALGGPFKKAQTKIIDLPGDDLETFERVLAFMYVGDYSPDGHLVDLDNCPVQSWGLDSKSFQQSAISPNTQPGQFKEAVSRCQGHTHLN
ncbi:hypothetical protein BJX65DRAFT_288767 [Aspergillus insuetus]